MEKNLKSAYRRDIKIWCWEQELWSKSLSLGLPFGFPTLDLDFGKLFNCSQPQFPHTWGCLLWRMAVRVQRESAQSLVMLFLNVGREGLLRFSLRKILGQEEGQDPCSFIEPGSKWFRPVHRVWKWWAAAPGSPPTRPCDFWETGQVSFELSILLKMQSSICAERVPWCWSAISIRSPWGLGVTVGVRWILTLLLQACKGAGGPRETLRCHTQWIPFCLVSVWSILYFLPVAVLSAALEGNRHEIHQFPPGRGKQMPDCLGKCCQVFLQACIKGWRRVRAGWAKISWWAGVGTDAWDVPCAWKTGSRGRCCWLLLPTTVRLGFRSRKGVSPERRRWTTIY